MPTALRSYRAALSFASLAACAAMTAGTFSRSARAQDAAPPNSTQESDPRFPRLRLAGSYFLANGEVAGFAAATSSVSVGYDFLRLSRLPGGTGDPAAVSLDIESIGGNPFHYAYGSQLFGGVYIRSWARPVYARLGIGVSHDDDFEDISYDSGLYSVSYREYAPPLRFAARVAFGVDVPRTPVFVEAGFAVDHGGFAVGAGFKLGVRL